MRILVFKWGSWVFGVVSDIYYFYFLLLFEIFFIIGGVIRFFFEKDLSLWL